MIQKVFFLQHKVGEMCFLNMGIYGVNMIFPIGFMGLVNVGKYTIHGLFIILLLVGEIQLEVALGEGNLLPGDEQLEQTKWIKLLQLHSFKLTYPLPKDFWIGYFLL